MITSWQSESKLKWNVGDTNILVIGNSSIRKMTQIGQRMFRSVCRYNNYIVDDDDRNDEIKPSNIGQSNVQMLISCLLASKTTTELLIPHVPWFSS